MFIPEPCTVTEILGLGERRKQGMVGRLQGFCVHDGCYRDRHWSSSRHCPSVVVVHVGTGQWFADEGQDTFISWDYCNPPHNPGHPGPTDRCSQKNVQSSWRPSHRKNRNHNSQSNYFLSSELFEQQVLILKVFQKNLTASFFIM